MCGALRCDRTCANVLCWSCTPSGNHVCTHMRMMCCGQYNHILTARVVAGRARTWAWIITYPCHAARLAFVRSGCGRRIRRPEGEHSACNSIRSRTETSSKWPIITLRLTDCPRSRDTRASSCSAFVMLAAAVRFQFQCGMQSMLAVC